MTEVGVEDFVGSDAVFVRLCETMGRDLVFDANVSTETLERLSDIIYEQKIPDAVTAKETLFAFLCAVNPMHRNASTRTLKDEDVWNLFFMELRQAKGGDRLVNSIKQVRQGRRSKSRS